MYEVARTSLLFFIVTLAKAGGQGNCSVRLPWMPAIAGMTVNVVSAVES
jgi:hypothetical protein